MTLHFTHRDAILEYLKAQSIQDASHDYYHLLRVEKCAQQLCRDVGQGNAEVICYSALLHDLVTFPKDDPRRSASSWHAAELASKLLKAFGLNAHLIDQVHHCIHAHSFSAGIEAKTIEAKIVQDADRMEALGAIGLARVFYTSGRMKRAMFDPVDPLARYRPLDDIAFALDHFFVKLYRVADSMQTAAGRQMAQDRRRILERYVEDLLQEI